MIDSLAILNSITEAGTKFRGAELVLVLNKIAKYNNEETEEKFSRNLGIRRDKLKAALVAGNFKDLSDARANCHVFKKEDHKGKDELDIVVNILRLGHKFPYLYFLHYEELEEALMTTIKLNVTDIFLLDATNKEKVLEFAEAVADDSSEF